MSGLTWGVGYVVEHAARFGKRRKSQAAKEMGGNSSEAVAICCGVLHCICGTLGLPFGHLQLSCPDAMLPLDVSWKGRPSSHHPVLTFERAHVELLSVQCKARYEAKSKVILGMCRHTRF